MLKPTKCVFLIVLLLLAFFVAFTPFHFEKASAVLEGFGIAESGDDGYVYGRSTSYSTARTTGYSSSNTSQSMRIGQAKVGVIYYVYRTFLKLNTTSLSNDTEINSVSLDVRLSAKSLSGANFTLQIRRWTDEVPISTSDFTSYDSTVHGAYETAGLGAAGSWYSMQVNDTSIVTREGYTKICLVSSLDMDATAPAGNEYFDIYSFDNGDGSDRPFLNVSYVAKGFNETLLLDVIEDPTKPNLWTSAGTGSFVIPNSWNEQVLPSTIRGRWVKLDSINTLHASKYVKGFEMQFYDADASTWRTPTAIYSVCGADGGAPASNFTDGSTSTYWSHSVNEYHNVIVDAGSYYNISRVRVYVGALEDYASRFSCGISVGFWHQWKENGTGPYLNAMNDGNYIYVERDNRVSGNWTFKKLNGWAGRWIENVTLTFRVKVTNTTCNITCGYWYDNSWQNVTISPNSTDWVVKSYVPYKYWNMSKVNALKFRFVSVGTGCQFYVDSVNASIYGWTLIERLKWYMNGSLIDWTNNYYGMLFGNTTVADMEKYVDDLADSHDWQNVLKWSARLKKIGIEREQSIRYALGNLTKAGELPRSGVGAYGDYWSVYDRDLLYATFYYAEKYGLTSTWNKNVAFNFLKNALETNTTFGVGLWVYASGQVTSGGSTGRYYDENAEVMSAYLIFHELNVTGAMAKALEIWNQVNTYHWNEAGLHYNYSATDAGYECEAPFFLKLASNLYWLNHYCGNQTRIPLDAIKRFLNESWQSPQWCLPPNYFFSVVHENPNNDQRRLENNFGAWCTLFDIYEALNATDQNNLAGMINGTNSWDAAWKLLYHPNSGLYDPSSSMFKVMSNDGVIDPMATARAVALQLLLGICPINATLAFPLEEMLYEYTYDLDPTLLNISLATRKMRLSIFKSGAVQFWYGESPAVHDFEYAGIYEVVFNESWTGIANVARIGDLPYDRKYLGKTNVDAFSVGIDGKAYAGQNVTFRTRWQTIGFIQANLSTAVFYWNASGSMAQSGIVSLSGSTAWSNFTLTIPNVRALAWFIVANDTYGSWGNTTVQYFEHPSLATVDFSPHVFSMWEKGKWVTAYLEVFRGYNVSNVDVSSILLNNTFSIDVNSYPIIGDYDNDTVPDLMIQFSRADVIWFVLENTELTGIVDSLFITATLTVTGTVDGTAFQASDGIGVICIIPGLGKNQNIPT